MVKIMLYQVILTGNNVQNNAIKFILTGNNVQNNALPGHNNWEKALNNA